MSNKVRLISVGISIVFLAAGIVFDQLGTDYFVFYAIFFGIAVIAAGWRVFYKAARNIMRGQVFDENFLMMIAAVGAFVLGLVWRESGEEMMDAVLVMILYQIGEFFESLAVGKSRRGIKELLSVRPDSALVLRDGKKIEVFPEEVAVGETIIVRAGERIPLDGVVISGTGYLDTSAITGESLPLHIGAGSAVVSGSISKDALLHIRTEKEFGESTVSKMLKMVEEAADKKSKQESFITKFAKIYTPLVVIAAVILAVLPPLITGVASGWVTNIWGDWIYRSLSLLVISCPCALVISVPITFFGGIGGLSKRGILVKGSNSFVPLSKVTTVVFDKTGTLTEGKFEIKSFDVQGVPEKDLFLMTAAVEKNFTHPIAQSIVDAAESYGSNPHIASDAVDVSGKGVKAVVDGKEFLAGNLALLAENGVQAKEVDVPYTVIYCALDGQYIGHFVIADKIKKDAFATVSALKKMKIKTVMLTGDRYAVAKAVADELGIDEFKSQLLPQNKVECVTEMIARGEKVMFMGDGINDAPVLAASDVGAAMGGLGSDATIEASDLVIMNDSPSGSITSINHAKKVNRVAAENIWGSLLVKLAIMVLALTGLTPGLWVAIIADVGVCLVAVFNAMRTMRVKGV